MYSGKISTRKRGQAETGVYRMLIKDKHWVSYITCYSSTVENQTNVRSVRALVKSFWY